MNNPMVKLVVAVAILLGGGWYGLSTYRAKMAEYEHRLDLDRIRRGFIERGTVTRGITDAGKYRTEMRQLYRWYFDELEEHYKNFGAFKNYDRFASELAERKKLGKVTENEIKQYESRYQQTKAFWEYVKGGKYEPLFSGEDHGLRFDVYQVQSVAESKEPRIRLYYALYGTQRKWIVESVTGIKISKLNVNAAFHDLVFSGLDANGKAIRELRASGDPVKIDAGDRFIDEFPPGLVFGYYELPKMPAEVVGAELTFDISTRSVLTGEEVAGRFAWKLPLESSWKLPPGVAWEGAKEEIREVDEAAGQK